jgi:adenylyltransferase/sulfurtransferase
LEIDVIEFNDLIDNNNITIIDVREKDEQPIVDEFEHLKIPLSELIMKQSLIDKDNVVVFCQTGKRSLQAIRLLNEFFNHSKKIVSLKNGIVEWKWIYAFNKAEQ